MPSCKAQQSSIVMLLALQSCHRWTDQTCDLHLYCTDVSAAIGDVQQQQRNAIWLQLHNPMTLSRQYCKHAAAIAGKEQMLDTTWMG